MSANSVHITGEATDGAFCFKYSKSSFIIVSPFFILSPAFTNTLNPCPPNFTVSIPMWIIILIPSLVVNPTACLVSNTNIISPSSGATTISSVGVTIAPSPIILLANASSAAVSKFADIPVIGLEITIDLTIFFLSLSSLKISSSLSSLLTALSFLLYSILGAVSR